MNKSTAYLSDSRPKFDPFEIDCGRIPAYRYHGTLKSELKAGTLPPPKPSPSSKTCSSSANWKR